MRKGRRKRCPRGMYFAAKLSMVPTYQGGTHCTLKEASMSCTQSQWAESGFWAVFAALLLAGFAFATDPQESAKQQDGANTKPVPVEQGPEFPVPFDADRKDGSRAPD